jgi:hypothetical protein
VSELPTCGYEAPLTSRKGVIAAGRSDSLGAPGGSRTADNTVYRQSRLR